MSVNAGETVTFKVNTTANAYHIDILRMGYYQGNGARTVASDCCRRSPLPQTQPACLNDSRRHRAHRLRQLGRLGLVGGADHRRVGRVLRPPGPQRHRRAASLIPFVVRNDASHSDMLFQTSDTTWQAYNTYGGNSLYTCTANCPTGSPDAYKGASMVSYNRPWHSAADDNGHSWLMCAEYPMIRFLEANGYDV